MALFNRTSSLLGPLSVRHLFQLKCWNFAQRRFVKIAEVGQLGNVYGKDKIYAPGQFFLHKVFGYRGAVLFQWSAKLFDRGTQVLDEKEADGSEIPKSGKDFKPEDVNYYQVLIDSRDAPYVHAQTESVTFLGSQEGSRSIYAIPGLDYVSHDDIIPYTSTEKVPIKHELFEKFLLHTPRSNPPYVPHDALKGWEKKNHPWLELSSVHRQTTEGIRVTAIPFFMGTRVNQPTIVYWWRYCIRIENLSSTAVILRERHWRIFSLSGTLETVRGRGVVGQEPVLSKSTPAFQYSSHVSLQSPNGHMWGSFRMERQDGHEFDVRIPPFSLDSKGDTEFAP